MMAVLSCPSSAKECTKMWEVFIDFAQNLRPLWINQVRFSSKLIILKDESYLTWTKSCSDMCAHCWITKFKLFCIAQKPMLFFLVRTLKINTPSKYIYIYINILKYIKLQPSHSTVDVLTSLLLIYSSIVQFNKCFANTQPTHSTQLCCCVNAMQLSV